MLRLMLVAAGLVGLLIAAPVAFAVVSAQDEYTLDLPSIKPQGGLGGPDAISLSVHEDGVVGENEAASSPFESTLTTFLQAPLAVALTLLGMLMYLLLPLARRYRQRFG